MSLDDVTTTSSNTGSNDSCFTPLVDKQVKAILQAKADLKLEQKRLEALQIKFLSQEHDLMAKRFLSKSAQFKQTELQEIVAVECYKDINDEIKSLSASVRRDFEKEWSTIEEHQQYLEREKLALRAESLILKNSNNELSASLCEIEALKRHLKRQISALGDLEESHRTTMCEVETQTSKLSRELGTQALHETHSTIEFPRIDIVELQPHHDLINSATDSIDILQTQHAQTQVTDFDIITVDAPIYHYRPDPVELFAEYTRRQERRLDFLKQKTIEEANSITHDAQRRLDDLATWSESIVRENQESCSCFEDLVTTFRLGDRKTIINYAQDVASDNIKCSINSICHNAWLQMLAKGTLELIAR